MVEPWWIRQGEPFTEFRHFGYEPLVRWSVDGSEIVPNAPRVGRFLMTRQRHLPTAKGMKWSDGEEFTADDIVFWTYVDSTRIYNPSRVATWLSRANKQQ